MVAARSRHNGRKIPRDEIGRTIFDQVGAPLALALRACHQMDSIFEQAAQSAASDATGILALSEQPLQADLEGLPGQQMLMRRRGLSPVATFHPNQALRAKRAKSWCYLRHSGWSSSFGAFGARATRE